MNSLSNSDKKNRVKDIRKNAETLDYELVRIKSGIDSICKELQVSSKCTNEINNYFFQEKNGKILDSLIRANVKFYEKFTKFDEPSGLEEIIVLEGYEFCESWLECKLKNNSKMTMPSMIENIRNKNMESWHSVLMEIGKKEYNDSR